MKKILKRKRASWFGIKSEHVPPKRKIFIGSGDFIKTGDEFLGYFTGLCGLKNNAAILDIGCGIGRMARPLTKFLTVDGSYSGMDIVIDGIQWAQKSYRQYPNFKFIHSDIFNKFYNKNGKIPADKYIFPFDDESFDFIFLTSVFTHMLPADLENYLSEISRVLKKSGKCLITYFLLNDESTKLIEAGKSRYDFPFNFEKYRLLDQEYPEKAIAFQESYIKQLYTNYNFNKNIEIHYGSWAERTSFLSFQDIIIAQK